MAQQQTVNNSTKQPTTPNNNWASEQETRSPFNYLQHVCVCLFVCVCVCLLAVTHNLEGIQEPETEREKQVDEYDWFISLFIWLDWNDGVDWVKELNCWDTLAREGGEREEEEEEEEEERQDNVVSNGTMINFDSYCSDFFMCSCEWNCGSGRRPPLNLSLEISESDGVPASQMAPTTRGGAPLPPPPPPPLPPPPSIYRTHTHTHI